MARKKKNSNTVYTEVVEVLDDTVEVTETTVDNVIGEEVLEEEVLEEEVLEEEVLEEELDNVTYVTSSIKRVFNDIAKKENATFVPYEIYRQGTPIVIKGPNGEPTKVTGLMTKLEPTILISFSDDTFIRAARKHIVNVKGKNTYVEDLSVGTSIDTITGTKTITTLKASDKKQLVYDLQVERDDHLFSDTAGIIHHNTFDITKTLHAEGLSEGKGYTMLKGGGSTAELYNTLFKNARVLPNGKQPILVFDDYDSVLTDDLAVNFLKGALDSGGVRYINYSTKSSDYFSPEDFKCVGAYTDPVTNKTHKGNFPDADNEIYIALTEGCTVTDLITAFRAEGWGNEKGKSTSKMTALILEVVGSRISAKEAKMLTAVISEEPLGELSVAEMSEQFDVIRIKGKIPSSFVFEGLAIFITNLELDSKLLAPLKSRSAKMEINLNASELIERIELINKKDGFKPFCEEFNISTSKIADTINAFKKKASKNPEDMSGALNVRAFTKALGVIGSDKHIKGDAFAFTDRYFGG
jgi:hypothetical protein